ncbi:hypothetical protein MMC12_003623 [Toensbergia leucococca]|nr:hypothetical protein [Toensbergia leucococca]
MSIPNLGQRSSLYAESVKISPDVSSLGLQGGHIKTADVPGNTESKLAWIKGPRVEREAGYEGFTSIPITNRPVEDFKKRWGVDDALVTIIQKL